MPMSRVAVSPKTAAETRVPSGSSRERAYSTKSAMVAFFDRFFWPGKTAAERSPSVGKRT